MFVAQFNVDTVANLISSQQGNDISSVGAGLLGRETYGFGNKLSQESLSIMMQDIALYACSGKFSINYAPTCITIKKQQDGIEYRIDKMVAYVYDSFDFLDQSHTFNDDGTISKLGQPVGAWDFEKRLFSIRGSSAQLVAYKFDNGYLMTSAYILKAREYNQYYIYNQDYQDYQKFTEYGLDFRLYSENFIATIDCSHCKFRTLYKRYNCDV